ncbi:hypothetical protein CWE04_11780 [Thomasclavelia cocleata]|uniref:Uncharacterized protein n=1 Tax=Thomasclavelia cocleata TaxID=69824 RepID=A0A1I0BJB2_9FIRM|nr:hypothetical protein [Thomasclavelia cocleata]MCR1960216.1 hypothetical protein [Thomasclavelia cocleata]NDO41810.1 hypothetical protein [Thomasclavelia cocleata]PJN79882.1 hypothetical protein CWE04_11780 [Thomasclavelia cocleata]SET07083.1 hypothetical protein SAMN04489758_101149 [Thomasclavelia cocleata]
MNNNENMLLDVEFEVDKSFDSKKFLKLKLRIMHDGKAAHKISFLPDSLKEAENTLYNSPILANVIFDDKNQPQFSSHDKHIEKDYAGNVRIIYDEIPIGVITESSTYEIKKESGRNYVYAEAYIWKRYSNYALDIINRDKNIKLSAEIQILDFYIDKKTNYKVVKKFKYDGITLLGNHRNPGMKNAQATIEFDNSKIDKKEYMIAIMNELKQCLHDFDNKNSKEGGDKILQVEKNKTDENQENKITDTITVKDSIEFELTANEVRKAICDAVRGLSVNSTSYIWLNDYDSKYLYLNKEQKINGVYTTNHLRRSYTLNDGKVTIGDDEIETVNKILTIDEWNTLETERKKQDIEFDELKAFKVNTVKAQRKAQLDVLFDKFDSSLKDVKEYVELKKNNVDFDLKTIEEKCFALFGRTKLESSVNFDESNNGKNSDGNKIEVVVTGADAEFEDDSQNDYLGGYLNKYYNK